MIKFSSQTVSNFENAIRGMRNPLESWKSMDSRFGIQNLDFDDPYEVDRLYITRSEWMRHNGYGEFEDCESEVDRINWLARSRDVEDWIWDSSLLDKDGPYEHRFYFGPKDLTLAQKLIRAGADESKFMRQIFVNTDITAPLYWWKEMDTYKVGTTANSTSTMHKLTSEPITVKDFSFDKELDNLKLETENYFNYDIKDAIDGVINDCELLRQKYIETNDKRYWRALIQLLPESYNQTRTWTANYAVLRNIYFARRNHKLSEWREFCKWIETLPWARELICLEEKKEK